MQNAVGFKITRFAVRHVVFFRTRWERNPTPLSHAAGPSSPSTVHTVAQDPHRGPLRTSPPYKPRRRVPLGSSPGTCSRGYQPTAWTTRSTTHGSSKRHQKKVNVALDPLHCRAWPLPSTAPTTTSTTERQGTHATRPSLPLSRLALDPGADLRHLPFIPPLLLPPPLHLPLRLPTRSHARISWLDQRLLAGLFLRWTQTSAIHRKWRVNTSAFLNRWTGGTEGRRILG